MKTKQRKEGIEEKKENKTKERGNKTKRRKGGIEEKKENTTKERREKKSHHDIPVPLWPGNAEMPTPKFPATSP